MLYTRKGDDGNTKLFGCGQKISKSSSVIEALGTIDEVNAFLGLCKIKAEEVSLITGNGVAIATLISKVQNVLCIIQAELAGFPETVIQNHVTDIESVINEIEQELPSIKTFLLSGGTEGSALFDIARTLARRAERRLCSVVEEGEVHVGQYTKEYMNRLSSLLYACARLSNKQADKIETPPWY